MAETAPSITAKSTPVPRPIAGPFRSRVIPLIGIALAVAGIILSFILTRSFFHYTILGEASGCSINSYVDCDRISDSSFAAIGPVPISSFALALHGAVLVALITAQFSPERVRDGLVGGTAILAIGATAVSVVLAVISAVIIRALCLHCTALQLVNLALAGTLVFGLGGGAAYFKQAMRVIEGSALRIGALAVGVSAGATLLATFSLMDVADRQLLERQITEARNVQPFAVRYLSVERFQFNIVDSPRLGDPSASITLVVYVDYNCPHCRVFDSRIIEIVRAADDVRLVYKFFPLDGTCNPYMPQGQRSTSCAAAAAAYAAHQEGKFWEYSEALFGNFQEYGVDRLVEYGHTIGMRDPDRIRSAPNDREIMDKINVDISEAIEADLRATPTLYVNGRKFLGVPPGRDQFSVIRSILEEAHGS